jgi:hypothetical protein
MTTRSDGKSKKFGDADNVGGESKHIETHHGHHEPVEVVKEKIKVKHHHHHHHHNHVKTIVKKEQVEKIVHVPVDKIVEKIVHVPKVRKFGGNVRLTLKLFQISALPSRKNCAGPSG